MATGDPLIFNNRTQYQPYRAPYRPVDIEPEWMEIPEATRQTIRVPMFTPSIDEITVERDMSRDYTRVRVAASLFVSDQALAENRNTLNRLFLEEVLREALRNAMYYVEANSTSPTTAADAVTSALRSVTLSKEQIESVEEVRPPYIESSLSLEEFFSNT